MFIQSLFKGDMRCGGIATRLVSDLNDVLPADAGAGPKDGASVGGAMSALSTSIKISSSWERSVDFGSTLLVSWS
jgi:hypothetical protein